MKWVLKKKSQIRWKQMHSGNEHPFQMAGFEEAQAKKLLQQIQIMFSLQNYIFYKLTIFLFVLQRTHQEHQIDV